ncbi:hypothetical protein GCM10007164_12950 [Luteimonas padinae]|uniref:DUF4156 domain-containing protein n=1 Tax=Luteimonas padinae TaxID=1714359 RepID=A0ABV6STI3_9GAMM|nr:hypothetical protein [Luteimonas padinae]GHD69540.1 hypothetical protein GCM10007164_12950 [Luteimonas padinae]
MTASRLLRLAAASTVLLLAGCASSHILTGTPRAPIDPAQVRVYYGAPGVPYEEIALLETSSGAFTYGEQNKTNSVMRKLREEAASLGANGILFQGTADGYGGGGVSVGAGTGRFGGRSYTSGGVGVNISPRQKQGRGVAIWMANPPPERAPLPPPAN